MVIQLISLNRKLVVIMKELKKNYKYWMSSIDCQPPAIKEFRTLSKIVKFITYQYNLLYNFVTFVIIKINDKGLAVKVLNTCGEEWQSLLNITEHLIQTVTCIHYYHGHYPLKYIIMGLYNNPN